MDELLKDNACDDIIINKSVNDCKENNDCIIIINIIIK